MSAHPILVLQMQRMGDMVLSFPALNRLAAAFPGHPIWVIGMRSFVEPLLRLSPQVTYFTYDNLPDVRTQRYHMVLNLSHGLEPAALAASVKAETRLGPWMRNDGAVFVEGAWQLYRTSLTHNNRYNLFHWADMHSLDYTGPVMLRAASAPVPKPLPAVAEGARTGLFLGASQEEKRPDAEFWVSLARMLIKAGHKPVLLGGPYERPLAKEVATRLRAPSLNLCGHFSVKTLADFIEGLDLFISPDTGPMHVAVWTKTPVLNLSMGPVQYWETGPYFPGHHVLRTRLACTGCWKCRHETVVCKEQMQPGRVAAAVASLLKNDTTRLAGKMAGLELLRSSRDTHGLFSLEQVCVGMPPTPKGKGKIPGVMEQECLGLAAAYDVSCFDETHEPHARMQLSRFWQAWFAVHFGLFAAEDLPAAAQALVSGAPQLAAALRESVQKMARLVLSFPRDSKAFCAALKKEWESCGPLVMPVSGYLQMYMENAGATPQSRLVVLQWVEELRELVK